MQATTLTPEAVASLLATLYVRTPLSRGNAPVEHVDALYLAIPYDVMRPALDEISKASKSLRNKLSTPLCYVMLTPELREILRTRGIYGEAPVFDGGYNIRKPLSHCYSLEVTSRGALVLKYVSIIGSKIIGSVTELQSKEIQAQILAAVARATEDALKAEAVPA